jgi:hypothetical protein
MLHHFFNLVGYSWDSMTRATATNTLGFIVWTLAITGMGWASTVAGTWFLFKRERQPEPFKKALRQSLWLGLFEAIGITVLVLFGWACFGIKTVYELHMSQNARIIQLGVENRRLERELHVRQHTIVMSDPVFENARRTMDIFKSMHQTLEPSTRMLPCKLYYTATKDSEQMASLVMQLANVTSYCYAGASMGRIDKDQDLYAMAMDGMKPGVVVIHAERSDDLARNLQFALDAMIPTALSYEPPKIPKDKLLVGNDPKEHFIWLQFGTGVKWRSEDKQQ